MELGRIKAQLGRTYADARAAFRRRLEDCDGDVKDDMVIEVVSKYHPKRKAEHASAFMYAPATNDKFKNDRVLQFYDKFSREWCTISWTTCLRVIYSKNVQKLMESLHKQDVVDAFRTSIHNTSRLSFIETRALMRRKTQDGRCALVGTCDTCGAPDVVEIDHCGSEFHEILYEFLNRLRINLEDVQLFSDRTSNIKHLHPTIHTEWVAFHDAHATYQTLCRHCHVQKTHQAKKKR